MLCCLSRHIQQTTKIEIRIFKLLFFISIIIHCVLNLIRFADSLNLNCHHIYLNSLLKEKNDQYKQNSNDPCIKQELTTTNDNKNKKIQTLFIAQILFSFLYSQNSEINTQKSALIRTNLRKKCVL